MTCDHGFHSIFLKPSSLCDAPPPEDPGGMVVRRGPPVVLQGVFGTEVSDSYQGRQLSALRLNAIISC